ncbi:DP-EP family protein [Shewanella algae]|uniref:DP-EP family protein n=1 Tax=Shewanella algae TaxID=38313 RepID=UPI001F1A1ADD|nr:DP-EP family protein [Shewanella algae]MCE9780922.1 DP-EP family protein [Shewanella algae]MCE9824909.1 DP-EP family protein [Shewanella algae]
MRIALMVSALLASFPLVLSAATQAEIDMAMAPVKSDAELQLLLAEPSPLVPLGQSLPAFINSLVFDKQGLVKLDRQLLQQPLSASEVYRILALFGWQSRMAEFDQAAQLSQTDSLLLRPRLPYCDVSEPVVLSVTLDSARQASFHYSQQGVECSGDVVVSEPAVITYQLLNLEDSPAGLKFVGAAFTNPFDGHIDRVEVSADGLTLQLHDPMRNTGTGKYQFLFSSEESPLLLASPDPEVINKPTN